MPRQQTSTSLRWSCVYLLSFLLTSLLGGCANNQQYDAINGTASTPNTTADSTHGYKPGDTIAVLLPQRGQYAGAARAVRDGLLTAQREIDESERPRLVFYDNSNAENTERTLQRAAADGARLAIGPLQKAAVNRLAVTPALPIATLALNSPQGDALPPENLYRFALDPEDEAKEVARAARGKGFSSALIIYPDSAWGMRIARAFMGRWTALGGVIEAGQHYNRETYDLAEPLDKLFQTAQYATTATGWNTKADFIFLVGTAREAQEIWPQIRQRVADQLPVFCTSHIYDGSFAALQRQGLGGLYFVDIPWMIAPLRDGSAALNGIRSGPRSSDSDYQRLFAMGLDAYRLAPIIAQTPNHKNPVLDGQTGVLSIDGLRRVRRQLPLVRIGSKGLSIQTQP